MIQDIAPHQFNVAYLPEEPKDSDGVVWLYDREVCLTTAPDYLTVEQARLLCPEGTLRFLFLIDDRRYFLLDHPFPETLPEGFVLENSRNLRNLPQLHQNFIGYTAWHLFNWYRSNRFCGKCGHELIDGTDERKLVCPQCGTIQYPRINPCIIVAVHDGDRLLMTKYAGRAVNWFVLIAGFMEIGESAEDTVRREVMEEAGVKVKNIRYFGSQPWGIPGNLTLGFTAELDGDDTITIDEAELSDGRWFNREDVPSRDEQLSITQEMIRAFKAHQF